MSRKTIEERPSSSLLLSDLLEKIAERPTALYSYLASASEPSIIEVAPGSLLENQVHAPDLRYGQRSSVPMGSWASLNISLSIRKGLYLSFSWCSILWTS